MRLKALLLSAFALISLSATAQDKIYKRDGSVIDGKVKEVSTRSISYKRADNPDGPDYVIPKGDVEKIKYQNGTEDYISGSRGDGMPARKPGKKIVYGNNIVSAAIININDEGFGFGLAYERSLDKRGIISFYLPVNLTLGDLNNYDPYSGSSNNSSFNRRIFQFMPGVKFYPTGSKGRVRYAVGPQLSYETGYKEEWAYNPVLPTPFSQYAKLDVQKFGVMINNSLNMFPNENLFIGIDLSLGMAYMNKKEDFITGNMNEQGTRQLAQFNFRIGYRF